MDDPKARLDGWGWRRPSVRPRPWRAGSPGRVRPRPPARSERPPAGRRSSLDAHALPDPDVRQLWAPVPAEVAGRLAQVRTARQRLLGPVEGPDGVQLGPRRTAEWNRTATSLSPAARRPVTSQRQVRNMCRRCQQLPVETDVGQRVEPSKTRATRCSVATAASTGTCAVIPIGLGDPLDAQLLVADERVGDSAGGHQIGVTPPGTWAGSHSFEPACRSCHAPLRDCLVTAPPGWDGPPAAPISRPKQRARTGNARPGRAILSRGAATASRIAPGDRLAPA